MNRKVEIECVLECPKHGTFYRTKERIKRHGCLRCFRDWIREDIARGCKKDLDTGDGMVTLKDD